MSGRLVSFWDGLFLRAMLSFRCVWPSYFSKTNPHCLKGVFPTLGIWVTPQSNPFKTQVKFHPLNAWMNHSWIRLSVYLWIHPAKHWFLSTVDSFLGAKMNSLLEEVVWVRKRFFYHCQESLFCGSKDFRSNGNCLKWMYRPFLEL